MTEAAYQFYGERVDHTCNMARFYAVEVSTTLFGEICLTRRWGRIGQGGQSRREIFAEPHEAAACLMALARRKLARGYRLKTGTTF